MSEAKSVGRESLLPPGPWHAKDGRIYAGRQVVAVVVCRKSEVVAEMLATFPDTMDAAKTVEDAAVAVTESEELKEENESLERSREDLEAERDDLLTARDNLRAKVEKLEGERELLVTRVGQLSDALMELRGEIARLTGGGPVGV